MMSRCDSAAMVSKTSELFPLARDAGDPPTGNVEPDVLEIVLARTAHFNVAERRVHALFIAYNA